MRRAAATALHWIAAGIGYVAGVLLIASLALDARAVRIERGDAP